MPEPAALKPAPPVATDDAPLLLRVLRGAAAVPPPVWLMRQAGRYLPEYRALRGAKGGFLDLVYDPEAAAEVTLQPVRRFALDAAILFSDILVIPHAMGQALDFTEGEGPELDPPLSGHGIETLQPAPNRLLPILETVRRVRAALSRDVALIGFAGAPWTVATYMVAGRGSRDQAAARLLAYRDRRRFAALIDAITGETIAFLRAQADAGADALMLFDSWAGACADRMFEQWVVGPTARIAAALRESHGHVPLIGFPRGAGPKLLSYAADTGVSALGLDETIDPAWAARMLPPDLPLQGNIDPVALLAGGDALDGAVVRLRAALAGRPHILNLGHGIIKETPVAHVERLLALARAPLPSGPA
jgi:uroporphyrinogen decarboxylase